MKIPILFNHDLQRVVGAIDITERSIPFRFSKDARIPKEMLFEVFGNAGIRIMETKQEPDGTILILAGEILEFSVPALSRSHNE